MATYLIAAVLFLLSLTGCGVQFEVSTPTVPTPTPRIFPGVDYSLGGVWRVQASPRVVFPNGENTQVQLFMQPQLPVLLLQDRQLYVVADYDMTWFSTPQSSAQVRVRAFTRSTDDDVWQPYDTAERDLNTTNAPANTHDSLVVLLIFSEPTALQVRAEISVIAYDADGSIITNVDATEFPVVVLENTDEIEVNTDAMIPQFGEWNENQMVFDWRDWRGGPCGLTDWGIDELYTACGAFENGDYETVLSSLASTLDKSEEPELRAAVFGQLGLLQIAAGDLDGAANAFNQAIESYGATSRPFEVGVHLHNLAATHIMHADDAATYSALQILQELRGQFYDEAGNILTQAIAGYYSGELWRLDEPLYWFEERGLPQANILQLWKIQANQ
jgi:hypothetical protein